MKTYLLLLLILLSGCNKVKKMEEAREQAKVDSIRQSKEQQKLNYETKDELTLKYFSIYFHQRNTSLCSIYKELINIEDSTIMIADIKYPDMGANHYNYQEEIYLKAKLKLFKRYNINDTLSAFISAFGYKYCK